MDNQEFSQEELVTEVIAACEVGDLDKVKDLIPKVSFQSPYNEKYADSKKIFIKACLSGNLDIVKFLIDTPYSSSTMNYPLFIEEALTDITNTADSKNYNIIPY
jgi:glycine cleavage system protein P-like pyridoxal-binding family